MNTTRLRTAAGIVLMVTLFYAPWALGCLKIWAVGGLTILTMLSGAMLACDCLLAARWPNIPRWCGWCCGLLLLQGWWMILNAHGDYQSIGIIVPDDSWWAGGPGAVDYSICRQMMWQITAVLVALLVACDLATDRPWRWALMTTIALTCISIAAYGLLQKAGVLPALAQRKYGESVFATFNYHGTAGAYLNLGIPAVFAFCARRRKWTGWAGLLLCLAAAFVNVSRAAAAIAVLIVITLAVWSGHWFSPRSRRRLIGGVALAIIAATIAGGGAAWRRWGQLDWKQIADNPRLLMLQIARPMAIEAGFFGEGPGSFKLLYFNSPHLPHELYERWEVAPYQIGTQTNINSYAHNDYLQFVIEWGWIGAALWAALIGGAVVMGVKAYRQAYVSDNRLLIASALVALGGVMLHALLDWPLQVASLQLEVAVYMALLYSN